MKERPILMSGPMVRAILDGRKTQTRRLVKGTVENVCKGGSPGWHADRLLVHMVKCQRDYCENVDEGRIGCGGYELSADGIATHSPYGQIGDRLWVRETWGLLSYTDETEWHQRSVVGLTEDDIRTHWNVVYAADLVSPYDFWRPSIHMPRWASRLTLEITGVRVERLNDISEADAIAEGVRQDRGRDVPAAMGGGVTPWFNYEEPDNWVTSAASSFATLWRSINGPGSWAENPWVWVVQFKRVTKRAVNSGDAGHEWAPREPEGWSVCSRCGLVRNYDREWPCRGAMPEIKPRDGSAS